MTSKTLRRAGILALLVLGPLLIKEAMRRSNTQIHRVVVPKTGSAGS